VISLLSLAAFSNNQKKSPKNNSWFIMTDGKKTEARGAFSVPGRKSRLSLVFSPSLRNLSI